MQRFFSVSFVAVVALVAGLGLVASARPGGGPGKLRSLDRQLGQLGQLGQLELDDATRAEVSDIMAAAREDGREQREALRDAREGLRELLSQEAPEEVAVLAQADLIGRLQTEARKRGLLTLLEVRALLPPEQREGFRDVMQRHHRPHAGCLDRGLD